jgi:hypothetical protein
MFGGKARQYPHLVNYLHYASQEPAPSARGILPLPMLAGLLSFWGAFTIGGIALQQPIVPILATAVTLPLGMWSARNPRPEESADSRRAREARDVAVTMRKCLDLRRLHRDLDEASLTVIEECARYWSKVRTIFDSGFWSQSDLPPAYAAARRQALEAADEGMRDVMLLYGPCLPSDVKGRGAMDYVEEALEQVVFGGPTASHLPHAFGPAREIADRLRDVATEAEGIAGDISRERLDETFTGSGSLRATLGELRAIRTAEDELRENLRE